MRVTSISVDYALQWFVLFALSPQYTVLVDAMFSNQFPYATHAHYIKYCCQY